MVQVIGLVQVVVYSAASKLELENQAKEKMDGNGQNLPIAETSDDIPKDRAVSKPGSEDSVKVPIADQPSSAENRSISIYDNFLQLPQSDLCNLCSLLGLEGYFHDLKLISGVFLKHLICYHNVLAVVS